MPLGVINMKSAEAKGIYMDYKHTPLPLHTTVFIINHLSHGCSYADSSHLIIMADYSER